MTRLFTISCTLIAIWVGQACSTGGSSSTPRGSSIANRNTGGGKDLGGDGGKKDDTQASPLTDSDIPKSYQIKSGPTVIKNSYVEYGTGKKGPLNGYYAVPQTSAGVSGHFLIAIHGRSGLSVGFQDMLKRFAGANYPVLAVNLFETNIPPKDSKQSDNFIAEVKLGGDSQAISNIMAGTKYLIEEKRAKSITLVGFGDGGTFAIKTAVNIKNQFKAVVTFYGALEALSEQQNNITSPIINFVGLKDPNVNQDLVRTLEATIKGNAFVNKEVRIFLYNEVNSGFFEPYDPNFNQVKADAAFTEIQTFLTKNVLN